LLGFLGVFYGGLVIAGLTTLWRQRELATWLSLWLGVPVAGTFTLAVWLNVYYDVRYIAMVLPAYVLILAAGVSRFQRTGVQMALLGLILLVHGAALTNYYFNPRYAREDARMAARYLEAAARPQDAILAVGTLSALPHYYRGTPPITALSNPIYPAQPVAQQVETLRQPYDRLWLVEIRPWQIDPAGVLRTALQETHDLVDQQHFPGVDVYAYQGYK
jgi:hypothetical protein